MSKDRIAERIEQLAGPVARDLGLELVQVQYRREAGGWVLRLLIDREGGPDVEDCKRLSRELGDVLDVEDPIPTAYRLEGSSPRHNGAKMAVAADGKNYGTIGGSLQVGGLLARAGPAAGQARGFSTLRRAAHRAADHGADRRPQEVHR